MGLYTTLGTFTMTAAEQSTAASNTYCGDAVGLLAGCRLKAQDLSYSLNTLIKYLPVNDANLTALNALLTSLS